MFDGQDEPRDVYRPIRDALRPHTTADLRARASALQTAYRDRGVTLALSGEERTFPLDLVTRVIGAGEWATLEVEVEVTRLV